MSPTPVSHSFICFYGIYSHYKFFLYSQLNLKGIYLYPQTKLKKPNLSISPLPTNKIKKNKKTKENRGELTPLCESIFDFNYILLYKIGDK